MVISWILNSVVKEIGDSLMSIPTAYEIWIDLRDRFHQSNAPQFFQIKKLLSGLHQGSMEVSAYYTRLKTLWYELKDFQPISVCHCGSMKEWVSYQNQECVMQFLMGLNESYAQIRAQILMMDPTPPISKIFLIVIQEERQRSIHHDISKLSPDLNVLYPNVAAVKVSKYVKNDKPAGGKVDKFCSHCQWPEHTADKCFKLHGYPPLHPKYKPQQQPHKEGIAMAHASSSTAESSFSSEQVKQLIALLSSQLQHGPRSSQVSQQHEPSVSCFHGIYSLSLKF
ncbi:uncharacterized protein [Primulina eburnea]|uniref:uncharacterized protein n=1 Tax=Primulina eburnea TaxID=1245227 RepID=UPI003C6C8A78